MLKPRAGERDADTLLAFLAVAAFLLQVLTVLLPHLRNMGEMPLQVNQAVLNGVSSNFYERQYQYQMYLQAPLLDWLWRRLPAQTASTFSLLYATYYAAGACGFLWTVSKGILVGDVVLSPDGSGRYRVGEVTGEYYYAPGQVLFHRRPVPPSRGGMGSRSRSCLTTSPPRRG